MSEAELQFIHSGRSARAVRETTSESEPTPWLGILSSPAMWWICAQQFFRAAGYIFFASWFPTYLQKVHGVTPSESGVLASLPLLAVVGGSLVGGAVSDRVLARTGSRAWARKGLAAEPLTSTAGDLMTGSAPTIREIEVDEVDQMGPGDAPIPR